MTIYPPVMGAVSILWRDYYAVTFDDSQIVANKDIRILFSKQYITDQVYFFHFLQIKYNGKILFAIYFQSPNTGPVMSQMHATKASHSYAQCWLLKGFCQRSFFVSMLSCLVEESQSYDKFFV